MCVDWCNVIAAESRLIVWLQCPKQNFRASFGSPFWQASQLTCARKWSPVLLSFAVLVNSVSAGVDIAGVSKRFGCGLWAAAFAPRCFRGQLQWHGDGGEKGCRRMAFSQGPPKFLATP